MYESDAALTRDCLRIDLGASEFEIFGVLHLDSRHCLIAAENLFHGTINTGFIYQSDK